VNLLSLPSDILNLIFMDAGDQMPLGVSKGYEQASRNALGFLGTLMHLDLLRLLLWYIAWVLTAKAKSFILEC
jgi:hypothetical protein